MPDSTKQPNNTPYTWEDLFTDKMSEQESKIWLMGWNACAGHINEYFPGLIARMNETKRKAFKDKYSQIHEAQTRLSPDEWGNKNEPA